MMFNDSPINYYPASSQCIIVAKICKFCVQAKNKAKMTSAKQTGKLMSERMKSEERKKLDMKIFFQFGTS